MSRLRNALDQLDLARRYNRVRIDSVPGAAWFVTPPGGVSHVAWQVGHLAFAEYRLCLERLRPRTPADEGLIPGEFIKAFGRDSTPDSVAGAGFDADRIRAVFDRVHERVLAELPGYPDADLDLPPLGIPHPWFTTRLGGLRYAPLHEMIHCGQIGLLRRMLGAKPIW